MDAKPSCFLKRIKEDIEEPARLLLEICVAAQFANVNYGVSQQLPSSIVMVRPASFGFNPETPNTILFQREITENSRKEIERRARMEFDMLANRLRAAGVEIYHLRRSGRSSIRRTRCFRTTGFLFIDDGTVVLYPMFAPSRRPERRRDIIENLQSAVFVCRELWISRCMKNKADFWKAPAALYSIMRIAWRTPHFSPRRRAGFE